MKIYRIEFGIDRFDTLLEGEVIEGWADFIKSDGSAWKHTDTSGCQFIAFKVGFFYCKKDAEAELSKRSRKRKAEVLKGLRDKIRNIGGYRMIKIDS